MRRSSRIFEHTRCRLHFGKTEGAAPERLSSRPHCSMFQSSSTCAACHAASTENSPRNMASASSAEPVSVVITCSAPSRHASSGMAALAACSAAGGWVTWTTPSPVLKSAPRCRFRREQNRIPKPRLTLAQFLRTGRAVEQKIRREIFFDLRFDRPRRVGDAVDDGVGEPRQRHIGRIDLVALRLPFRGDRLRQLKRRRRERPPRRRAYGLIVEIDGMALGAACGARVLVKAPPERRTGVAACATPSGLRA